MPITNAQLTGLMRADYKKPFTDTLVLGADPVLALINKTETEGEKVVCPVVYGGLATNSSQFSRAKTLSDNNTVGVVRFEGTVMPYFCAAQVPGQTVRATRNNQGAFVKATKITADAGFSRWGQIQAAYAYGNGYGSLGRVAFTADTLTFANPESVRLLEVGSQLQMCVDEDSTALRNSGAVVTVAKILSRSLGTVLLTGNVTATIAAAVTTDFCFMADERGAGASPARQLIAGFRAWSPATVSSSDLFYNVNRSTDSRLVMNISGGLGKTGVDALIDATQAIANQSMLAKPNNAIISVNRMGTLLKELESTRVRSELVVVKGKDVDISFPGVKIKTQFGDIEVVASPYLSDNDGYVIQANTWTFFTNGRAPDFVSMGEGKSDWIDLENSDALLAKIGGDAIMLCGAPCWNTRIDYTA